MTKTYTVELTDTEDKALSYVCQSQQDWISNAATARATSAINDIISINMAQCNADGVAIETGIDAQVTQAFDRGYVKSSS